jgi:hypothetical protein
MKQIENRIIEAPPDSVFITADFLDIADTQAVNKALSRLAEEKKIRRIIRGLYDLPRYSELLQEFAAPKIENVAKAIARNFRWSIVPCGDTALNMLGLSTQVPAVWQYVSDGPYREYSVDSCLLKFNHTSNKDITGISYKSALVIQALKALGEHHTTNDMIRKLRKALSENEKTTLLQETQFGTVWIFEIVKDICRQEKIQ